MIEKCMFGIYLVNTGWTLKILPFTLFFFCRKKNLLELKYLLVLYSLISRKSFRKFWIDIFVSYCMVRATGTLDTQTFSCKKPWWGCEDLTKATYWVTLSQTYTLTDTHTHCYISLIQISGIYQYICIYSCM